MMVRRAMLVLCFALLTVFMASCGQTYELQSISVVAMPAGAITSSSPIADLEGIGSSANLVVTAHYSNTKTEDVTVKANYGTSAPSPTGVKLDAPLGAVTVNQSGHASVVDPACTWTATANGTGYTYTPYYYTVTVTYSGYTTYAYLAVASETGCYDGITYVHP
jgi:hypothetical protein